jgi:hypothetical protein
MNLLKAVTSDNAFAYRRSYAFRETLEHHGARDILTPPYAPLWKGKVEPFSQIPEEGLGTCPPVWSTSARLFQ